MLPGGLKRHMDKPEGCGHSHCTRSEVPLTEIPHILFGGEDRLAFFQAHSYLEFKDADTELNIKITFKGFITEKQPIYRVR